MYKLKSVCINIAKCWNEKLLWAQNLWNPTYQNEFYFGQVKVMTKFEKNTKKWLTLYSSLYEEQEYVILKCV